jgi:hypothetical protein
LTTNANVATVLGSIPPTSYGGIRGAADESVLNTVVVNYDMNLFSVIVLKWSFHEIFSF